MLKFNWERKIYDMKKIQTFKRLFSYLKEHKLKLLFVILSSIVSTGFMVFAPFLIGKVTTILLTSVRDGVLSLIHI